MGHGLQRAPLTAEEFDKVRQKTRSEFARIEKEEAAFAEKAEELAASAEIKERIRRRYFSIPGATDAEFEADYPKLLRAYRHSVAVAEDDVTSEREASLEDPKFWGLD